MRRIIGQFRRITNGAAALARGLPAPFDGGRSRRERLLTSRTL
ncbi:hypothetical protein [Lysobacter gummosus]